MYVHISNSSSEPIYSQIVSQIKGAILSGILKQGDPLPSMRHLAKELRISVITTKRAYEELEGEGYIVSQIGKGSFVAPRNMELLKEQQLRKVESHLISAIEESKAYGISLDELKEMLMLLGSEEEK